MGPFDARALANRILDIADELGVSLTLMQLIKLVYLAHGWWLAFSDRPLTDTPPQAWQYGPVHPTVYRAFKQFGRMPITGRAIDPNTGRPFFADLSGEENDLVRQVVGAYGHLHAFSLSDMMHQDGTPWSIINKAFGDYAAIPDNLIREHFQELHEKRTKEAVT